MRISLQYKNERGIIIVCPEKHRKHLWQILVINQLNAQKSCFIISLLYASTCFEHCVLIITRSKLYYTASGIITPIGGRPVHRLREGFSQAVHRTATYRCDDTRCCIIQFLSPDNENIVLETCRGMK